METIIDKLFKQTDETKRQTDLWFKIVFPLLILFAIWTTIGSYKDSKLTLDKLDFKEGRIQRYEYFETQTRYDTYYHIRIFMENGETYEINSDWSHRFPQIEKSFDISNYIEFYVRKQDQTKWRGGTTKNIYQLKIGNEMIYSINERQAKSFALSFFGILMLCFGLIVFLVRRYNKANDDNPYKMKINKIYNWIKYR